MTRDYGNTGWNFGNYDLRIILDLQYFASCAALSAKNYKH